MKTKEVKKIFFKCLLLIAPIFLYYFAYKYYIIKSEIFFKTVDSGPIYKAIKKSKTHTEKKIIILGESVCAQHFPVEKTHKRLYSLPTTAPSTIVGAYILIRNLCEYNNLRGKKIFYLCHPIFLNNSLDQELTYNHFVKPFYKSANKKYLTIEALKELSSIPYLYASQLPFIKASDWSPSFDFKNQKGQNTIEISNLNIKYIQKIKELASQEGFSFFLRSPLLHPKFKNLNLKKLLDQAKNNKIESVFNDYLNNIFYIDSTLFLYDHHHFKTSIFKIYDEDELLKKLNINHM